MKYLCLVYLEEEKLDALSKSESAALMGECFAYAEGIRKNGHHLAAEALQPVQTATTLRIRNGKLSYLIDARNLNEAVRVASKIPPARLGSVEVRPIRELKQP